MIDSKKLLYIFPDVAYLAEGLPTKKPHSFSIHSFTQINGNFLTEDAFLNDNIQKLFSKLEAGETYHIILPDFLFTSTIVSIKEKSDSQIKEELQAHTFPKMGISKDTHLIDSAVLNEIRGTSRVQLSAIEKDLLAPLRVAAQDHAVAVSGVSPLSWAIKSLISLEPSISVLQMGSNLYACEHYIGIDQAAFAAIDDIESIAETIKTLKGSEPSIQTVYLLSNHLVEEKLKENLTKTVPIQQMADDANEEDRMPASVKEVIEFSFKTLSIPDYPVPVFALTKPTADEVAEFGAAAVTPTSDEDEDFAEAVLPKPAAPVAEKSAETELPKPGSKSEPTPSTDELDEETDAEDLDSADGSDADEPKATVPAATTSKPAIETTTDNTPSILPGITATPMSVLPGAATTIAPTTDTPTRPLSARATAEESEYEEVSSQTAAKEVPAAEQTPKEKPQVSPSVVTPITQKTNDDIDLTQFVGAQSKLDSSKPAAAPVAAAKPLPTIKNKSGVQNMLKMIFITLAVFCITVAVGIGVGLAILKYSGSETTEQTPVVEVETTPTPTPTATPEPTPVASESASVAPTNLKILVVNATTKAGYAGTFKTKIEGSKLGKVTAANAKGKYEKGYIVYMPKRNDAAIATLEKATDLETTFDESAKGEDPQGTYDLILVLAE